MAERANKAERINKEEIQELGLRAIKDFFQIDPYKELDATTLHILHNKARIAMQFEREMNVGKRAVENNYIRVFRMIAEDKKELKKLIKSHLPKYYVK